MRGFTLQIIALFLTAILLVGVNSDLYCFQCLSVDCSPQDDPDYCASVTSFIRSELGDLYYNTDHMEICPSGEHAPQEWRIFQLSNEPCPALKGSEATCTAGRMQLRVKVHHPNINSVTDRVVHASVLGCAKRTLLRNTHHALGQLKCDEDVRNRTFPNGDNYLLKIEHCRERSTHCYEYDYCVHERESEVRVWPEVEENNTRSRSLLSWKVGTFACIVLIVVACLFAGCIKNVSSPPANNKPPVLRNVINAELKRESPPLKTVSYSVDIEEASQVQRAVSRGVQRAAVVTTFPEEIHVAPPPPGHSRS